MSRAFPSSSFFGLMAKERLSAGRQLSSSGFGRAESMLTLSFSPLFSPSSRPASLLFFFLPPPCLPTPLLHQITNMNPHPEALSLGKITQAQYDAARAAFVDEWVKLGDGNGNEIDETMENWIVVAGLR